jgi:hypothetical protein
LGIASSRETLFLPSTRDLASVDYPDEMETEFQEIVSVPKRHPERSGAKSRDPWALA